MFVGKTIQSGKVVFVVDDCGIGIFVGSEVHIIFGLFLSELNTRSLQMSLHLFDFDVTLSLWVKQTKSRQNCLRLIRFELLLLKHSKHVGFEFSVFDWLIRLIFFDLDLKAALPQGESRLWLELLKGTAPNISLRRELISYRFGFSFCHRKVRRPLLFWSWGSPTSFFSQSSASCCPKAFSFRDG